VFSKRSTRSLAAVLALACACALGAGAGAEETAIDALGPAPRADDGDFTNPAGALTHGTFGVRFPFFLRRIGGAFRTRPGAPSSVANDGAWLRDNAGHSVPSVTWIGHATLLIQMDHVTFLTDPIWSDTTSPVPGLGPRRFVPPGVALDDLPEIDFAVVSHNHYDHLDLATLTAIHERSPRARFFVPLGNRELLVDAGIAPANVIELDWGETHGYAGVEVHCLPAQHWSRRGLADENASLWASWAVTGSERRVYFAGDTGYFDGFARIAKAFGRFDLAAVPIGAYEPVAMMREAHLDPEEAVQAAVDLRADRALAMHFGTFDLSDEPLEEPPRRFRAAAAEAPFGEDGAWVLEIGETREF